MQNLLAGDPIAKQIEDLKLDILIYEVDRGSDAQFTTVKHACFRGEHRLLWEYALMGARDHLNAPAKREEMIAELETELLADRNLA
ncbi:hypothetical protein [Halocynthiibacter namhaensis]|uniref:hypothetical protein n=1 Tax=Halocynthiibacter namhaensis TaxID=1290553 RepID=UPI0005792460|nr:hypothetical protein [Halocynthiibacter namhaensis]